MMEFGVLPVERITSFEFSMILAYHDGKGARLSENRQVGTFMNGIGTDGTLPGNPVSHVQH